MNRNRDRNHGAAAALASALVLLLTACSTSGAQGDGAGQEEGFFSLQVQDPDSPLVPSDTTESEGTQILKALFVGLVTYDNETTEVTQDGVAESVESSDNQTFTVRLEDGWTFHDGSPVTASSFTRAWNYAALSTNAQGASSFFERVQGYDALQGVTDDAGNEVSPPTAQEMSGLRVVDDRTFTIALTEPFAQFPQVLGYNAFFPLPEAFFRDPDAFGRRPVGNGPFRADTDFVPGQGMRLSAYDDYAGPDEPRARGIDVRVYSDLNTAYTDLQAGNLDVVRPSVPPEVVGTAREELGDRFVERDAAGFDYLGFPTYDPRFADKRVRQAFSMAVDRQAIADAVYSGSREPATDIIPPVIPGHRDDACTYCRYDPDAARSLLSEAGFDTATPVDLWFNAGGSADQWVTAAGNQLRQNLGVEYRLRGDLQPTEYLPLVAEKGVTGPFRLGWGMDYPSPQNFLEPLFGTAALPPAGSNNVFYSNPEFDRLVTEGNTAADDEAAVAKYQEADDLLLEDMPAMPMFFRRTQGAYSPGVADVAFDSFQDVDLTAVTVAQP